MGVGGSICPKPHSKLVTEPGWIQAPSMRLSSGLITGGPVYIKGPSVPGMSDYSTHPQSVP